jgi:hypothetical protein
VLDPVAINGVSMTTAHFHELEMVVTGKGSYLRD